MTGAERASSIGHPKIGGPQIKRDRSGMDDKAETVKAGILRDDRYASGDFARLYALSGKMNLSYMLLIMSQKKTKQARRYILC